LQISPQYPPLIAALRDCKFKGLLREVEAEAGTGTDRRVLSQGNLL